MIPKVFLRRGNAGAPLGRNPWVQAETVERLEERILDGSVVDLFDRDRWIARGLYNSRSQIRVRLFTWKIDEALDADLILRRIKGALELRKDLGLVEPGQSSRLIFSEADQLSGLVVDRLRSVLIVQLTSLGLYGYLDLIIEELSKIEGIDAILLKEDALWEKEGLPEKGDRVLWGKLPTSLSVVENAIEYEIDLSTAQKTGFYLDQRVNRELLSSLSRDKRILDLCCYTGGFSLNAKKGGAKSVTAIDSSESAIHQAQRNALRNKLEVQFIEADVLRWADQSTELFDGVIFDPPKLIPNKKSKPAGLRAYFHHNEQVLKKVRPGGYFMTFSCSGALESDEFLSLLTAVSRRSGRGLRLLERLSQPADHPVLLSAPSSQYLKGFLFQAE